MIKNTAEWAVFFTPNWGWNDGRAPRTEEKCVKNFSQSDLLGGRKPLGKTATACGLNSAGSRWLRGLAFLALLTNLRLSWNLINCGPVRLATGSGPNPISNFTSWATTSHMPSSIFICKQCSAGKRKNVKYFQHLIFHDS